VKCNRAEIEAVGVISTVEITSGPLGGRPAIAWAFVQRHAWQEEEAARDRQVEAGQKHGKEGGRGHKKTLPMEPAEGLSGPTGETREEYGMASFLCGNSRFGCYLVTRLLAGPWALS
jgi:hypothetical protein